MICRKCVGKRKTPKCVYFSWYFKFYIFNIYLWYYDDITWFGFNWTRSNLLTPNPWVRLNRCPIRVWKHRVTTITELKDSAEREREFKYSHSQANLQLYKSCWNVEIIPYNWCLLKPQQIQYLFQKDIFFSAMIVGWIQRDWLIYFFTKGKSEGIEKFG